MIPTFNRPQILKRTVTLLKGNLRYSGPLRIWIGCDGSDLPPETLSDIDSVSLLSPGSGSLGANLNRLHDAARSAGIDFYFALDDDHWLMNPLRLDEHVTRLQNDTSAGWIHLLMDAVGDEDNDGYAFSARLDGKYWRVDYAGADQWPCSFRAHLSHRRFHDAVGAFPAGLPTGKTEWEFNQRALRMGRAGQLPAVLVPVCAYGFDYWAHVGKSWNRRGL